LGCIYDTLSSASSDAHTEKYLELLGNLLDDLVSEQQRFQQYSKTVSKTRQEHLRWLMKQLQEARDNGSSSLAKIFIEHLLTFFLRVCMQ
jgi:hypothetical protein